MARTRRAHAAGSADHRWNWSKSLSLPVRLRAPLLALLLAGAAPLPVSLEDLIARPSEPNDRIREISRQVRATPGGTTGKLERLIDLIFDEKHGMGFSYDARLTLTAGEAVIRREGNCLTLVNLAISIARSAGIRAEYVEVEDFESFYRQQQTIIRTTHVIAGIEVSGSMTYIDFLPRRPKSYRGTRPISDRRAAALFYNALAAEAMLEKDYELAEQRFREALEVDDRFAETWNNYAVLQRRQGHLEEALASLERAHELDPRLLPPIENLAAIHRRAGRLETAQEFEALAIREKTKNPYFLLRTALEHLANGELAEAERLLNIARRLEPEEPEIYLALGRVEMVKGETRSATKLFEQARRKSTQRTDQFQLLLKRKIDRLLAGVGQEAP